MLVLMGVFVESGELCASGDRLQTIRPCTGIISVLQNQLRHLIPSALAPKFRVFCLISSCPCLLLS